MKKSIFTTETTSLVKSSDFKIKIQSRDSYAGPAARKGMTENPRDRLENQLRKGGSFTTEMVRVGKHADENEAESDFEKEDQKQRIKADEKLKKQTKSKYRVDDLDLNDSDARSWHTDGGDMEKIELQPEEADEQFNQEKQYSFIIKEKSQRDEQDDLFLKAFDEKRKLPEGVSQKEFDKLANLHENSPALLEKKKAKKAKKSFSARIADIFKGGPGSGPKNGKAKDPEPDDEPVESRPVHNEDEFDRSKKSLAPKVLAQNFVKSSGKGGMTFDFGWRTGNPFADNATILLNRHSDPIQKNIAKSQRAQWESAQEKFTEVGERAYEGKAETQNYADPHGGLNKSHDQQVKDAHEKGMLYANTGGAAVKNDFNKSELKLGGETIQATSETDAALIEMMKSGSLEE